MEEYTDKWSQLMERVIVKLEKECREWQRELEKHGFSYVWDSACEYVCRCEVISALDDIKNNYIDEAKDCTAHGLAPAKMPVEEKALRKALKTPDLLQKLTDTDTLQNWAYSAEKWISLEYDLKEKFKEAATW